MMQTTTGEIREISILDLKGGAISERVGIEIANILKNVLDPNTKAKEKRVLSIKFEFSPSEDREAVAVRTSVSAKLSPYMPIESTLIVGGTEDSPAAMEFNKQIPGQQDFDGEESSQSNIIKLPKRETVTA